MARLTVMSWNLHSGADWLWRKHLPEIADAIAAANPDVVAFQEADRYWGPRSSWVDQPAWLAERLGMELLFAPHLKPRMRGHEPGERQFGPGLLTRLPVLASHVHVMHSVARRVPWTVHDPALPELVLDVDGTAVSAFSIHLDVMRAEQRRREASELVSILRAHRRPIVLMGDLNADNFARPIGVLKLEGGFTDACAAVGHHVRTFPAALPVRRLDHVLVRGLVPVRAAAGTSRASDHLPIVVKLEIPAAPRA